MRYQKVDSTTGMTYEQQVDFATALMNLSFALLKSFKGAISLIVSGFLLYAIQMTIQYGSTFLFALLGKTGVMLWLSYGLLAGALIIMWVIVVVLLTQQGFIALVALATMLVHFLYIFPFYENVLSGHSFFWALGLTVLTYYFVQALILTLYATCNVRIEVDLDDMHHKPPALNRLQALLYVLTDIIRQWTLLIAPITKWLHTIDVISGSKVVVFLQLPWDITFKIFNYFLFYAENINF